MLAFNLSNRYLDLDPVLGRQAADAGLVCRIAYDIDISTEERQSGKQRSIWAVLAESADDLDGLTADPPVAHCHISARLSRMDRRFFRYDAPRPLAAAANCTEDNSKKRDQTHCRVTLLQNESCPAREKPMAKTDYSRAMRQIGPASFDAGTTSGLSDGQLLERFLANDREAADLAFAGLVDRHGPMVFRVCNAVLRNEEDAFDAFQASFLILSS